jgi:hypothetical protein
MPAWKNDTNRHDRREILRLCNKIIQAWKDKKADLLEEKSESLPETPRDSGISSVNFAGLKRIPHVGHTFTYLLKEENSTSRI